MEKVPTKDLAVPPPVRDARGVVCGDKLIVSGGQVNPTGFISNIYCLTLGISKGNSF